MTAEQTISALGRHIRMALRAEQEIAEQRFNQLVRRLILLSFAGLASVCGMVALNVAGFFALATLWSPALAMLAIGLGDLLVATLILVIATSERSVMKVVSAEEIRIHAYEAIDLDLKLATRDLARVARHPLGALIMPALSLLASWLMKNLPGRDRGRAD